MNAPESGTRSNHNFLPVDRRIAAHVRHRSRIRHIFAGIYFRADFSIWLVRCWLLAVLGRELEREKREKNV